MSTAMATNEQVVRLADGRRVGLAHLGDPAGYPVVVAHGTPASRLGHEFLDEPARARGLRVVCIDRPGMGLSDPKPDRTLSGWAADVAGVADELEFDRFAAFGYSGGGPYALACGARLSERVSAVATMAGVGPVEEPADLEGLSKGDRQLLGLSKRHPHVAGLVLRGMKLGARI